MNWFEYKGIRSSDMGLRIEQKDVFSAPQYDVAFKEIPGRDGDVILPNGRFPNVQIAYSVFLPAKTQQELAEKITAVKAWLYTAQDRYHTLSDTYDTKYFRKAVFAAKLDIEDELNRIGVFTVTFSCLPYRYSTAGSSTVEISQSGQNIVNPTAFASRPYMKVFGNGRGTLAIQSAEQNATWSFEGIDEYIEIDAAQMNFYKDTQPKNDTVTGNGFPVLNTGENTISFTGGITGVTVVPRWVTI